MAIKYLAGRRMQGTSAERTGKTFEEDFTNGATDVWSHAESSYTSRTGNEVRFDYSTGVDYDIELKRTSATTVEAKIFTDNFGTLIGTSTDTISGTTGLRYLFVGSRNNTGAGNTGTNFAGTIQSIKFQNGTSEWME